jgi:hypothetical protein
MLDMPYFMENPDWYFFNGERFELTNKAPEKAKESYANYYIEEKQQNELRP